MKNLSYETYLGVLLFVGMFLLSVGGAERMKISEVSSQKENRIVVIDAGHGGNDPGKIAVNQALEKDINLAIARKLKNCLEKEQIQVVMTRTDENGLYKESDTHKKQADMRARCAVIEQAAPDLTVSIHQNSYTSESVKGPQVFYHEDSKAGEQAAACLQEALNTGLSIERPREKKANHTYYILRRTKSPSVIVECGFLSNSTEAELLVTDAYQQQVAEAICRGIKEFLSQEVVET